MEIEVVEFYEISRNDQLKFLQGTLHVYIIDDKIDLRGVRVFKNKDKWKFYTPVKKTIDQTTKKYVIYPVFSYSSMQKNKELIKELQTKGKEYILSNVLSKKNDCD